MKARAYIFTTNITWDIETSRHRDDCKLSSTKQYPLSMTWADALQGNKASMLELRGVRVQYSHRQREGFFLFFPSFFLPTEFFNPKSIDARQARRAHICTCPLHFTTPCRLGLFNRGPHAPTS